MSVEHLHISQADLFPGQGGNPNLKVPHLDRGVISKFSFALGFEVLMYLDHPGEYFDIRANPIPAAIARRAGFDTERLEVERAARAGLAAAQANLAAAAKPTDSGDLRTGKTYRLRAAGDGLASIWTHDGAQIVPPRPVAQAEALFNEMEA